MSQTIPTPDDMRQRAVDLQPALAERAPIADRNRKLRRFRGRDSGIRCEWHGAPRDSSRPAEMTARTCTPENEPPPQGLRWAVRPSVTPVAGRANDVRPAGHGRREPTAALAPGWQPVWQARPADAMILA